MAVHTKDQHKSEARVREKRRGKRMNSRVPVRLEWDAPSGKRVTLDAHTRVVGHFGCLTIVPQDLPLEHRMVLVNLATNSKAIAVIVWKGGPRPEGWEYGLELVGPDMDFWGLEL